MGLAEEASQPLSGSLYLLSSSVVSLTSSILASIFVARFLSVDEMGIYALIMLWPNIIQLLAKMGVPGYILRYFSYYINRGEGELAYTAFARGLYVQSMLVMPIIVITVLYPRDIFSILYGKEVNDLLIQLTTVIFITWILRFDLYSLLEANMDMLGSSISRVMYYIPRAALAIALTYLGYGVLGALTGDILGGVISTLVGFLISANQRLLKFIPPRMCIDGLGDMISFTFPIYLVNVLNNGMRNYILWLLGLFSIEDVVGNYYVTLRFSALIQVITLPLSRIIVPTLSRMDRSNIDRAMYYVYRYAAIVIVPIPIFALFMSRDMIYGLFGSKYKLAPDLLMIFSLIYVFAIFGYHVIPSLLLSIGRTKQIFYGLGISFLILMVIAPILVFYYSAHGAVLSLLISALGGSAGLIYFARDLIPYPPIRENSKTLASAILSGLIIYIIWINFRFQRSIYNIAFFFAIYILLYLIFIAFTSSINERELEVIYRSVSRVAILGPLIMPLIGLERRLIRLSNKLRIH